MMTRRTATWIALTVLALPLAACGGDDDNAGESSASSDTAGTTSEQSTDTQSTESTEAVPTEPDPACPEEPVTLEVQLANEFAGEPTVPLTTMTVVDAIAVQIDEAGTAFTVYLADYSLDREAIENDAFHTPVPGPDQTLVTVFVTAFNAEEPLPPLVAGDIVEGSSEFGTRVLNVIGQQGETSYNSGNPDGQLEVLAVDAGHLCATIDYFDLVDPNDPASAEQKIVRGSFTADVVLWALA